jgi:hypothetical protein
MITLMWKGEDELYRNLFRFERRTLDKTGDFVRFAARWLEMDIRTNWSMKSPSDAGKAPAVDTGNLDSSVLAEPIGREGGRFARDVDTMAYYVRVDTSKGDNPDGRGGYSQALEEGTNRMAARPFMRPAIDRLRLAFEPMAHREIRP